jgi:hypothetical protein
MVVQMKIAYILLTHRDPAQIERLVSRLIDPDSCVFIHVDRRTRAGIYEEAASRLHGYANLRFIERVRSNYASFGLVQAAIDGLRTALAGGTGFDYFILLSEQDYPIKPRSEIAATLGNGAGASFMEYRDLKSGQVGWEDRYECYHFNFIRKHGISEPLTKALKIRMSFPHGLKAYGGSQWWCLTEECVRYVLGFIDDNPGYVRFFKRTWAPDEMFFQSIVMNSPLAGRIVNDNLRYIDWPIPGSSHPAVLTMADYARLLASQALFARKFDIRLDSGILDVLDGRCGFHEAGCPGKPAVTETMSR